MSKSVLFIAFIPQWLAVDLQIGKARGSVSVAWHGMKE